MRSTRRKSGKSVRSDIAQAAARLVAEGGASSFAAAKRKAATSMGLDNFRNLPDNNEVQAALIEYQRLFEGDRLVHRIVSMRREALAAMMVLADFTPRLVGPVLYGTACEHSPVTLHLYTDELERVTRFLHDRKIDYQLTHTTLKTSPRRREEFPTFLVANQGLELELVVFPLAFLAHPPLSSLNGRPFRRADTKVLKNLIAVESTLSPVVTKSETDAVPGGL
jgi:hypothetical protein